MYDNPHKIKLLKQSVKRVITQKEPDGGVNDFCNLVKWQLKDPNLKLCDAFERVVYMTKFN